MFDHKNDCSTELVKINPITIAIFVHIQMRYDAQNRIKNECYDP